MGLLTHWVNKEAREAAFKLLLNKLFPALNENRGKVKPGWEKLPPMKKKGSVFLTDQAI